MNPEITAQLFDAPVSCCIATPEMYSANLWGEEANCIAGAVTKRRREFIAGRTAARRALLDLGIPEGPILGNRDRSPIWPPGVVGSISHCDSCCVAVVGRRGELKSLGIDVELAEPLHDDILRMVSDDTERSQCYIDLSLQRCNLGKLIFCAKEAFYKCYYPLTATVLDFLDVSVHFSESKENGRGEFYASLKRPDHPNLPQGSNLKGRWYIADGLIFAGATLT